MDQLRQPPLFRPIAVIGISCRLPGAPNIEAFADLLRRGEDAVTEIPAERWSRENYLHLDPKQPGRSYTMAAGIIADVDRFDAAFFGISPREAVQMDPQQRLLLELTHDALENAGLPGRHLGGSRTGVYIGGSSSDYMALRLGDLSVADAYFMTGSTLSTLSNRISYVFDLHGPSFTVDTACSSSLVALHLASTAIQRGEIDVAIVGGVNLLLSPQNFVGFSRASMLSPRGRCHAFAANADGYVRAEGGGVVVLKSLDAARADGDPIRAIVEGSGINSDGRTAGLSLPSRGAQAALLREVYGASRIDPDDLVYVEAHGTGTAVGDPIEAGALGDVLGRHRKRPLPIGSVKTNIGHLEAGSGMAGLLKAMLVLRDGVIPASLHCSVPNPHIDFAGLNLALVSQATPIEAQSALRAAAINSFGFGGTNAHVVLSEGSEAAIRPSRKAPGKGVVSDDLPALLVSARSDAALASLAQSWRNLLDGIPSSTAAPLLRAAARGREHHSQRLVASGSTISDIVTALDAYTARMDCNDLATGSALASGSVAFIYSGNGSQWAGMGEDGMRNPAFRKAMEEVESHLTPLLGWSVIDRLRTADAEMMRRTNIAQPLLFAVQHATTRALRAAGITPSAHLGHSVGEVAAASGAGALSLKDAAHVIAVRSTAQERTAHQGRMAVLGLGPDEALALLDQVRGVEIAAVNGRHSITVAGPALALQHLERLAARRRVHIVMLDLDYAFHSAAMEPIRTDLLHDLAGIRPNRAREEFYSTVLGRAHDGSGLDADYWWLNVRAPVRFVDALATAIGGGSRILLEIGPNPVLQSYLRDGLRQAEVPGRVMGTLSRKVPNGDPFRRLAAHLHVAGHDISGSPAFAGPIDTAALDRLPSYPWQRERYWYEATAEATDTISARRDHPLLGSRRGQEPSLWFNTLDTISQPWLADHAVGGAALLPATAMVEIALAAARARWPEVTTLDVLDLEITRPMLLERHMARETRFSVAGQRGVFELASRNRLSGEAWTVHATGRIAAGSPADLMVLDVSGDVQSRLSATDLYALTAGLGLQYGPAFQTVAQVSVHATDAAIVDLVAPSGDLSLLGYLTDPARMDGALQGLVALAAAKMGDREVALLPWRIGRVRLTHPTGASIARAHLRVNRVGPRSISADVALLDANDVVVASFGDCWFTRVGSATEDDLAEHVFHTIALPKPRSGQRMAPPNPLVLSILGTTGEDEAALLTDAFIAASAFPTIAGLADAGRALNLAAVVRDGRVHAEAAPLLTAMLSWLERDGLAEYAGGIWTLTEADDLPPPADIWCSILAGCPTAVAEASLAGTMAEALPALLAKGRIAMPAGLAALTLHMQLGSPTALAVLERMATELAVFAASWPVGRPMRVLEVGAIEGTVTARLVDALARSGRTVSYVAAATPDADPQAILAATSALPGATVMTWNLRDEPSGVVATGSFDLVVGVCALTRAQATMDALVRVQNLMSADGALLLAEPEPNRVWDLRFGLEPAWLGTEGGSSALQDGASWIRRLQSVGFANSNVASIGKAVWAASLITATGHGIASAVPAATSLDAGLVILALPDDPLAAMVADMLLAEGRTSVALRLEGAEQVLRASPPRDGDLLFVVPDSADEASLLEDIAVVGAMLGGWSTALAETTALRLWLVVRTDDADAIVASALRGVVRVLANEAPNLLPRVLRVDRALTLDAGARLIATEIAAPDGETEIALAAETRLVPRLRRGLGQSASAARQGSAKLVVGRPGLLDTLQWQAMKSSVPGPNEVAIAVAAAGLNFRDVMWSMGLLPDEALLDGLAGATLGLECAGTVTAIGANVEGLRIGDRVMAIAPACLSTNVIAPAQSVVGLPDDVDFAAGATVPVAFLTVCYALGTLANLQPGERVLIHGGAGGVGLAAIQYARHRGAIIFASAGSPAKRAVLRLLGVDHVLDTRSLAFADEVMAATEGQGVDVVLNSLAGEAMERSVGILRPFGRFLELGKRDLYGNTPLGLRALRHNVSYFAIDADQLPVQRPEVARRIFAEIQALMGQGVLRPLPHRLFRFGEATEAFRLMQSSGHIGKIVLVPEPDGVRVVAGRAEWKPNPEGTYLVTGGLSGFGLQTAKFLASQGVRSLALVGRRGLGTLGATDVLADFASQGVLAQAFACDVSDEAAMRYVLGHIRSDMLPLCGVVHAAMVLDDGLLPQLTEARFAQVLRPKLGGAMVLDRLTRKDPIELFLLFSSITTTLGNPGQANYVAANAGLEALAASRRRAGLAGMSIGWGPISDVGYLSREQAVSDALAQRMGEMHLTSYAALALLPTLLASGQSHIDVARLRWGALRQHLPHLNTPCFADILSGHTGGETGHVDLAMLLAESTPEEARILVGEILVEEVAAITKAPSHQIDLNRSLTDLGMDSLMALELRMSLERRFGNNLPLLSLADGASIGAIAARIVRQLSVAVPDAKPDAAASMLAKYEPDAEDLPPEETCTLTEDDFSLGAVSGHE